ncbi:hypothetical protein ACDA63_14455 [Uliginosibacterium sp. sgz301328]
MVTSLSITKKLLARRGELPANVHEQSRRRSINESAGKKGPFNAARMGCNGGRFTLPPYTVGNRKSFNPQQRAKKQMNIDPQLTADTRIADTATAVADNANSPDTLDPKYRAKVEAAAEKFESFFIASMLQQMRRTTRELADDDSPSKDPINQDMLEMADARLADVMAGQRAFGIADAILKQILPADKARA